MTEGERLRAAEELPGKMTDAGLPASPQTRERRKGALSKRAGSITAAQTRARTPCTAIPTRRKGNNSSHTNGYRISASNATGQHNTKRKHQSRKAIMGTSY